MLLDGFLRQTLYPLAASSAAFVYYYPYTSKKVFKNIGLYDMYTTAEGEVKSFAKDTLKLPVFTAEKSKIIAVEKVEKPEIYEKVEEAPAATAAAPENATDKE